MGSPRQEIVVGEPAKGREATNGRAPVVKPAGKKMETAHIVIEEIRRVAKERANGMTLDSAIAESGMDSLERMEILATLEERFGGRFPPEILPELETTRQVIAAVQKYLGAEPRTTASPAATEIPPETYHVDQFPEYRQLRERLEMLDGLGWETPTLACMRALPTIGR